MWLLYPSLVDPLAHEPTKGRAVRVLVFVGSAVLAAAILQGAWQQPKVALVLLIVFLIVVALRFRALHKQRALLRSGDVYGILERWTPTLARIPYPETMAPLVTATAFAAFGWVEQARAAIAAAHRGPAWDAALEHRLFLEALLCTFEGDRDEAIEKAWMLASLPLPEGASARAERLRAAVGALTRAFAHKSRPGDRALLEETGERSPLVFWAMRYAAAVIAIDEGDRPRALSLLQEAPVWPAQSTFRAFHDEILSHASAT